MLGEPQRPVFQRAVAHIVDAVSLPPGEVAARFRVALQLPQVGGRPITGLHLATLEGEPPFESRGDEIRRRVAWQVGREYVVEVAPVGDLAANLLQQSARGPLVCDRDAAVSVQPPFVVPCQSNDILWRVPTRIALTIGNKTRKMRSMGGAERNPR